MAGGHQEAHSGRSDGLSSGQIVLIAIFSVATPLAAFIATAVVICMKRKRRREQEKDDAEARKQNEQNASHMTHHHHNSMSSPKRSSNSALTNLDTSHHMIKNTWDKSVNNMSASASLDDGCLMNSSLYGALPATYDSNPSSSEQCYQAAAIPATLQRAKSQKQLNTDPMVMHRASQMIATGSGTTAGGQSSQHVAGPIAGVSSAGVSSSSAAVSVVNPKEMLLEKRISVLSDVSLCNSRWSGAPQNRQIIGPCSPPHV